MAGLESGLGSALLTFHVNAVSAATSISFHYNFVYRADDMLLSVHVCT